MPDINALVIGKFSPPHRGHGLMLQFAVAISDEFTVLIADEPNTTPSLSNRYFWVYDFIDNIRGSSYKPFEVLELETPVFQNLQYDYHGTVTNNEKFWNYWVSIVSGLVVDNIGNSITHIISSDYYGQELAKRCGLEWIPFDPERDMTRRLSASSIRAVNNGYSFNHLLSKDVRRHYVQTVCFVGTESTGKTTMAKRMASDHGGSHVPEYGRTVSEVKGKGLTEADFDMIAKGQRAMNDVAMADASRPLVVFDTDIYATWWFNKFYLGVNDTRLFEEACHQEFDKYILFAPTIPWVDDGSRVMSNQKDREKHHKDIMQFLTNTFKNFEVVDEIEKTKRAHQTTSIINRLLMDKFKKP